MSMDHSHKSRKCEHKVEEVSDQSAAHQDGAAGGGLQAGQATCQQSSVAALGIVLQSDAVRLGVLHDQTRVLGLRQAGVQFTSTGIHEVKLRKMSGAVVNYPSIVVMEMEKGSVSTGGTVTMEIPIAAAASVERAELEECVQHHGQQHHHHTAAAFQHRNYRILIVIGEISTGHHLDAARKQITQGLRSWSVDLTVCDLNKELQLFEARHTAQFSAEVKGEEEEDEGEEEEEEQGGSNGHLLGGALDGSLT
ncbi:hypothetical protein INR49_020096 [Caranx melampygus]|nr:hypothetical protein INR49_020096 [Caranx melampygus]